MLATDCCQRIPASAQQDACQCIVPLDRCCVLQSDWQHRISLVIINLQVGTFVKKVLRTMFARLMPPPADADADTPVTADAAGATSLCTLMTASRL